MSYYPTSLANLTYPTDPSYLSRPDLLDQPNRSDPSQPDWDWFMLKHWNGISEWVNQPVQMKANQKRNRKIKWFFCTFPEGGKSIIRPFSRKKGGKEAENNFLTFFPEKGRKFDFPTVRKAEGGGRFLPEAILFDQANTLRLGRPTRRFLHTYYGKEKVADSGLVPSCHPGWENME